MERVLPVTYKQRSIFVMAMCFGFVCLIFSISFAVSVGAVSIPLSTVWGVVLNKIIPDFVVVEWTAGRMSIVWDVRFPRVLLACLVGAGLAMVGASLQAVTRNPLADPHLLGISAGGALGAILALLHTGLFLGLLTVPLFAFLGALIATLLVLLVSNFASATSSDRLILAGVAVSFILMSLANVLIFLGDPRATHTVVFWMLGGTWPRSMGPVGLSTIYFTGVWIIPLF